MSKLLVLDLDETLIYAAEQPLDRPPDFRCGHYSVYRRPHLAEFLEFAKQNFRVAVWTSSTDSYARGICREILGPGYGLEFLWSRSKCTQRFNELTQGFDHQKDLRKVKKRGFALEEVIVVDDSPSKLTRNYGNLVRVRPFYGDPADRELPMLSEYLLELSRVENIRAVEKRGWQSGYE